MDVVIGSFAVEKRLGYNYSTTKPIKDIDIITKENKENHLVKIKRKPDYYNINEEIYDDYIMDYVSLRENTSDELIYNWCNQNKNQCIKTEYGLIPPIQILYVIYLSHIHRIIPYSDLNENIKIWESQYAKYIKLREKVGYEIDDILYNQPNSDLYKIFNMRFGETNEKYKDTDIDMNKSENEFFKDNVERYFDHDFIHSQVALMLRGEHILLFSKFQKDGSVAIDEEKFSKSTNSIKINMFQEETTVLFLERYIIPTLINNYKNQNKNFTGFDDQYMKFKLKEICLHLILNLSGSGHHFLRRYGINHYRQIMDLGSYNIEKIVNLALNITRIERHIDDIIINFSNMNNVELFLDKLILNHIENKTNKYYIESNKDEPDFISDLENELNLQVFKNDKIFTKLVNYVKKYDKIVYKENNLYYCPKTNIGVYSNNFINSISTDTYFVSNKIKDIYVIFTIKNIHSNTNVNKVKEIYARYDSTQKIYSLLADTKIEIEYMSVNEVNNIFSLKAVQNGIMTYYKSSGCEFGNQEIIEQEFGYMNSYGDIPQCFHKLLENTFKYYLKTELNYSNASNYEEFHERNDDDEYYDE